MTQEDDEINTTQAVKEDTLSNHDYSMLEFRALVAYINAAPTPEERQRRKNANYLALYGGISKISKSVLAGSPTGRITDATPPPFHKFTKENKS